jgi:hypothetical protein
MCASWCPSEPTVIAKWIVTMKVRIMVGTIYKGKKNIFAYKLFNFVMLGWLLNC